jgi:hypothetical protein
MTLQAMQKNAVLGMLCLALLGSLPAQKAGRLFAAPPRNLSVAADITDVHVLDQNWSDDESRWFYNVAQGSHLVRYNWFLKLEQPDSNAPFLDAGHIRTLGYLPRTAESPGNPDGLPIGFAKDGLYLGLTCAACHTTQINYQHEAWLIDGAPTLADFETFQRRLTSALDRTFQDNAKFDRFAAQVLGAAATPADKAALRGQLQKAVTQRQAYNTRNLPADAAHQFGPGRVDAFGAIMNEVTSTFAQAPTNYFAADAPVSYPFLWDTPQHDKVQWNGAAPNTKVLLLAPVLGTSHVGALSRNAGEVMGVFGTVDATNGGSLLDPKGYPSSVNIANLIDIEESLRKLWSPQWPTKFGPINPTLRATGETLFRANCTTRCHDPIVRTDPDRTVTARMAAIDTDQAMARNFATRNAKTGVYQGRLYVVPGLRRFGEEEPVKDMLIHTIERALIWTVLPGTLSVAEQPLLANLTRDFTVDAELRIDGRTLKGSFNSFKMADDKFVSGIVKGQRALEKLHAVEGDKLFHLDRFGSAAAIGRLVAPDNTTISLGQWLPAEADAPPNGIEITAAAGATVSYAYKGRPLNGIWATAPYLHNGSVPNLDELLKPPAQRVKKFLLGSREFDPLKVGFRTDEGTFEFDTTQRGNSNAGHDYGREFTDQERKALIEYLKSL